MVHFSVVHGQSQFLGFGTSLNSIVAASPQYSFHLLVFQLPERTQCTASFFIDTPIRNILPVAKTTLGLNTAASSGYLLQQEIPRQNPTLGGDPELLFPQTFPDKNAFDLTSLIFTAAILFANLLPTWVNFRDPTLSTPSIEPSSSGKGNGSHDVHPCGLHGYSHLAGLQICASC